MVLQLITVSMDSIRRSNRTYLAEGNALYSVHELKKIIQRSRSTENTELLEAETYPLASVCRSEGPTPSAGLVARFVVADVLRGVHAAVLRGAGDLIVYELDIRL